MSAILKDKLGTQSIDSIIYHRKNMRPVELSLEGEYTDTAE